MRKLIIAAVLALTIISCATPEDLRIAGESTHQFIADSEQKIDDKTEQAKVEPDPKKAAAIMQVVNRMRVGLDAVKGVYDKSLNEDGTLNISKGSMAVLGLIPPPWGTVAELAAFGVMGAITGWQTSRKKKALEATVAAEKAQQAAEAEAEKATASATSVITALHEARKDVPELDEGFKIAGDKISAKMTDDAYELVNTVRAEAKAADVERKVDAAVAEVRATVPA